MKVTGPLGLSLRNGNIEIGQYGELSPSEPEPATCIGR